MPGHRGPWVGPVCLAQDCGQASARSGPGAGASNQQSSTQEQEERQEGRPFGEHSGQAAGPLGPARGSVPLEQVSAGPSERAGRDGSEVAGSGRGPDWGACGRGRGCRGQSWGLGPACWPAPVDNGVGAVGGAGAQPPGSAPIPVDAGVGLSALDGAEPQGIPRARRRQVLARGIGPVASFKLQFGEALACKTAERGKLREQAPVPVFLFPALGARKHGGEGQGGHGSMGARRRARCLRTGSSGSGAPGGPRAVGGLVGWGGLVARGGQGPGVDRG